MDRGIYEPPITTRNPHLTISFGLICINWHYYAKPPLIYQYLIYRTLIITLDRSHHYAGEMWTEKKMFTKIHDFPANNILWISYTG